MSRIIDSIKSHLCKDVRDGVFHIDSILPSIPELAKRFNCGADSVKEALEELGREGIITRKRCLGSYFKKMPPRGKVCIIATLDSVPSAGLFDTVYTALSRASFQVQYIPVGSKIPQGTEIIVDLMRFSDTPAITDCFQKYIKLNAITPTGAAVPNIYNIHYNQWNIACKLRDYLLEKRHRQVTFPKYIHGLNKFDTAINPLLQAPIVDMLYTAGIVAVESETQTTGARDRLMNLLQSGVTAILGAVPIEDMYALIKWAPQGVEVIGGFYDGAQGMAPTLHHLDFPAQETANAVVRACLDEAVEGNLVVEAGFV